jgi:hypothetical protein
MRWPAWLLGSTTQALDSSYVQRVTSRPASVKARGDQLAHFAAGDAARA